MCKKYFAHEKFKNVLENYKQRFVEFTSSNIVKEMFWNLF